MSERNDGGPAFPSHGSMGEVVQEGMSLRDWFASQTILNPSVLPEEAKKVIGEISNEQQITVQDVMARAAYRMADAMLKARKA